MSHSAQQHPGLFARLFGRKQETDTGWTSFRTEQKRKQETGEILVEYLRRPAQHNPTRINGLARAVRTPRITLPPFETWMQLRTSITPLPPTRQTGKIQPISEPLHIEEDKLPSWARPNDTSDEWLNSNVANLKVWAEPRQSTGALEALAALAAQKPDEDTKEVPSVMRKRHTKESEA